MTLSDDCPHILIVDDDRRLRDLLTRFMQENGYRVTSASHAGEAEARREGLRFDAVILDVMMPGESGFDYAKRLKASSDAPPILMLTARADSQDRIRGLESGVDDYLPKPFEPRELILRLANILRRNGQGLPREEASVRFGPFLFRFDRGELTRDGEPVRLAEHERDILTILGKRANQNVPREALAQGQPNSSERTIDVQMTRLRRKIETDPAEPRFLQTVRGIGYRLAAD